MARKPFLVRVFRGSTAVFGMRLLGSMEEDCAFPKIFVGLQTTDSRPFFALWERERDVFSGLSGARKQCTKSCDIQDFSSDNTQDWSVLPFKDVITAWRFPSKASEIFERSENSLNVTCLKGFNLLLSLTLHNVWYYTFLSDFYSINIFGCY